MPISMDDGRLSVIGGRANLPPARQGDQAQAKAQQVRRGVLPAAQSKE
jgi:hypothetical protein